MKNFFTKNMGYFISILVVLFYFALSFFGVEGWRVDVAQVVTEGVLLFISSVIINNALLKQGIQNGKNSKEYDETLTAHLLMKQKVLPNIKYLQGWLDKDYYNLLHIGRSVYVNSAGYDYDKLFDKKGKVKIDFEITKPEIKCKWYKWIFVYLFGSEMRLYRERKRFINKAKRYKITRLKVTDVLNIDSNKDPNNFGSTVSDYEKRQSGFNTLTKIFFSFFMPSISFIFYGFSFESLISQLIGIALSLISSFFTMYSAYVFMVRTHRNSIINIINKLEEFNNTNLTELKKELEEKEDVSIHSEESLPAEGNMVQEACRNSEFGEKNNLPSNANSGL